MKKIIILSICLLMGINLFSQNKLINAGKIGKVSNSVKTETPKPKATTPKKQKTDDKYKSVGYMDIRDITFANVDNDNNIIDKFGSKLYAKEVKYLKPKISYNGLTNKEKEVLLYVKIINEDGKLHSGTNSPEGFTYEMNVKVVPGKEKSISLLGWGNSLGTSYKAGLYKVQIWCNDNKISEKEIRLYSGTTPIATSNLISIDRVSFRNGDKNGNVIDDFGSTLYDGKVKYLVPKIYYNGKYSTNQEATLYFRIFNSSGNLVCGSDSPIGFSKKEPVVIKPGSNSMIILGYGSSEGTTYKEGTCKFEIWLDGEKLYETNVYIKKAELQEKYHQNGNEMVLRDMLEKPMGIGYCNPITAPYSSVKSSLSSTYTIDDRSDDDENKFYIWSNSNSAHNLSYHNLPLDRFLFMVSKISILMRRILYAFEIRKSEMTEPTNPYPYLDKIVQDFKNMGINMSYKRKYEDYLKAKGEVNVGDLEYTLVLEEYSDYWEISINIWVWNR